VLKPNDNFTLLGTPRELPLRITRSRFVIINNTKVVLTNWMRRSDIIEHRLFAGDQHTPHKMMAVVSAGKWRVIEEKDNTYLWEWRNAKCFQIDVEPFSENVSFHITSVKKLTIKGKTKGTFEQLGQKTRQLFPEYFLGVLPEQISFIGQYQLFSNDHLVFACSDNLVCAIEGHQSDMVVRIGQHVKTFWVDMFGTSKASSTSYSDCWTNRISL
jgi:hypothetical protein